MGYYTQYYLDVKGGLTEDRCMEIVRILSEKVNGVEVDEELEAVYRKDMKAYGITEPIQEIVGGGEVLWYDHDKDMMEIARKFPDLYFTLEGEGEDSDDLWKAYYHGDKSDISMAIITYDKPDWMP